MRLEEEIQQRVFKDDFHKAHVNLLFTAAWVNARLTRLMKKYGVSVEQFNILRILKGMGEQPASIKRISCRMLDKSSNTGRLVDKMAEKGLVERNFCPLDRRQMEIRLTAMGHVTLNHCNALLEADIRDTMHGLDGQQARVLNELLEQLRATGS